MAFTSKAVFEIRQVQVAPRGRPPFPPNQLDDPIEELAELNEFLTSIQETFQAASAVYLKDLNAFKPHPRESLLKLADRFDEVAIPLLTAGLMTSRGLALTQRRHTPIHIEKATLAVTMREDERCFCVGELLVDKEKEGFILEFEAEMRAAGQTPNPRSGDNGQPIPLPEAPRPHRPVRERLGSRARDVKERLRPKIGDTPMMDT